MLTGVKKISSILSLTFFCFMSIVVLCLAICKSEEKKSLYPRFHLCVYGGKIFLRLQLVLAHSGRVLGNLLLHDLQSNQVQT